MAPLFAGGCDRERDMLRGMCTLVAWVSVFEDAPLAVAANRDERLLRPAEGPRIWDEPVPFLAPVDVLGGGTWWALNAFGIFIGLTNRAGAAVDDQRRSRGLLVTDLAQSESLAEAEAALQALDPSVYNGFHLLATDGRDAVRAIGTGFTLEVKRLGPGRHVLTERGFGASDRSRDGRVQALMAPLEAATFDARAVARALATHDDEPLDAVCVHVDAIGYGTRSSTILTTGGRRTLLFAPGPPCRTPYDDARPLLDAVLAGGGKAV